MQLTDAPTVINVSYRLDPADGKYYINLSFDTGHSETFLVDNAIVDQDKLAF